MSQANDRCTVFQDVGLFLKFIPSHLGKEYYPGEPIQDTQ